ncbi:MAG: NAD(+) synthase [Firmicutes bacterium]|nr:NAD(+) synthase [Bacillota bacterium]
MEREIGLLVQWLRDRRAEAGMRGLLVGVSGGIDSAVVASLISRAAGENSLGVILACSNSSEDLEDARLVCRTIGLPHLEYDLLEARDSIFPGILDKLPGSPAIREEYRRIADANLRARLRMSSLYTLANALGYLVVGTDNAAEVYTGYFTKYGDGGVDLLPLSQFTKREVRALGSLLGVPERVILKDPTAGLWAGQTDEGEMGVTYQEIDDLLEGKPIGEQARERIEHLHRVTEHKRRLAAAYQREGR